MKELYDWVLKYILRSTDNIIKMVTHLLLPPTNSRATYKEILTSNQLVLFFVVFLNKRHSYLFRPCCINHWKGGRNELKGISGSSIKANVKVYTWVEINSHANTCGQTAGKQRYRSLRTLSRPWTSSASLQQRPVSLWAVQKRLKLADRENWSLSSVQHYWGHDCHAVFWASH